jgi:DNA-directed RNA polymerase alpha subunit
MANSIPDNIAAPAKRALAGAGYTTLEQLSRVSERELLELHGMGPKAVAQLREAMAAHGLRLRTA